MIGFFFFFRQKTAYDMRISDWSSDVCSSDLADARETEAITPADPLAEIADEDRAERGADVDAHIEDRIGAVAADVGEPVQLPHHHRDIRLEKARADDDEGERRPEDVDRGIILTADALDRHQTVPDGEQKAAEPRPQERRVGKGGGRKG